MAVRLPSHAPQAHTCCINVKQTPGTASQRPKCAAGNTVHPLALVLRRPDGITLEDSGSIPTPSQLLLQQGDVAPVESEEAREVRGLRGVRGAVRVGGG